MNVEQTLNRRLDDEYNRIKPYLNNTKCCADLHKMCENCDGFMGVAQHNYEDCKNKNCFRFYLAYSILESDIGYELFGGIV